MIRVALATVTGGLVGTVATHPLIVRPVAAFLADTPLSVLDAKSAAFALAVGVTAMTLAVVNDGINYGREKALKAEAEALRSKAATQNSHRLRIERLTAEVADRHAEVERREADADERVQGLVNDEAEAQTERQALKRIRDLFDTVAMQDRAMQAWAQTDAERKTLAEERTALAGDRIALDAAAIVQSTRVEADDDPLWQRAREMVARLDREADESDDGFAGLSDAEVVQKLRDRLNRQLEQIGAEFDRTSDAEVNQDLRDRLAPFVQHVVIDADLTEHERAEANHLRSRVMIATGSSRDEVQRLTLDELRGLLPDGAKVVDELDRGSQFVGQFKRIDIPAATRWYDTKAGKMVSAETVRKATA